MSNQDEWILSQLRKAGVVNQGDLDVARNLCVIIPEPWDGDHATSGRYTDAMHVRAGQITQITLGILYGLKRYNGGIAMSDASCSLSSAVGMMVDSVL